MDNNIHPNPFDENQQVESLPPFDESKIQPIEAENRGRPFVWLILGVAVIGCCTLFVTAFFFFQPDTKSLVDKYFPSPTATLTKAPTPTPIVTPTRTLTPPPTRTPTPTLTSTPHALITPSQGESVFEETFDSNDQKWYGYYDNSTVLVEGGRLIIRSETTGNIGVAFCTSCPILNDTFYFQAEVSTLTNTFDSYGLAFCSPGYGSGFYVFQMNSRTHFFDLYKHSAAGWGALATSRMSPAINNFPMTNTIGVYFDHGAISLYVNGTLVNSYKDENPLQCRKTGFIVNEGKLDMVVDNVFTYNVQTTPTPVP